MSILNILNSLTATGSRLGKVEILTQNKANRDLMEFFRLSLDPLITFGIKKIPDYTPLDSNFGTEHDLAWAMTELINCFQTRAMTGNKAIDYLTYILESIGSEDAICIERIIGKDPRCGVADATVNSVWPGLIFEFPIMKASPHDEKTIKKIKFPAYSQVKIDGARCAAVVEKNSVVCLSSSGRPIETHGQFDWLVGMIESEYVLDGELVCVEKDGTFMNRKKSNGIVNKAVKGTISVEEAKMLHLVAFDFIVLSAWKKGSGGLTYKERNSMLLALAARPGWSNNASIADTEIVGSEEEMMEDFYKRYRAGQEGTIVKNFDNYWENKRSQTQIKLKGIITCDLRVVGVEKGTGKNKDRMGNLNLSSADGLVKCSVGTGFSDAERDQPFDTWLDQVVEVAYNERILSKVEGSTYSLFLPRFLRIRIDKDEADSIDNISEKGE